MRDAEPACPGHAPHRQVSNLDWITVFHYIFSHEIELQNDLSGRVPRSPEKRFPVSDPMRAFPMNSPLARLVLVAGCAGWLVVPGQVQAHGNTDFLQTGANLDLARGLYLNGWFSTHPDRPNNPRNPVYPEDLVAIRQAGFRYVRIAVSPENFLEDGVFSATNLFATRLWTALTDCLNAELPVQVVLSPRADAMDTWFATQAGMNAYKAIVGRIAQQLADYPPNAMALELTAEPAIPEGGFATWDYIQDRLYDAARTYLPTQLIVMTAADYSTIEALPGTDFSRYTHYSTNDQHVVWSYHNYQPKLFTSQGAPFKADRVGQQRLWPYFHDLPFPCTNAQGQPFENYFDSAALYAYLLETGETASYETDLTDAQTLFTEYSTGTPVDYDEQWLRSRYRDAARWGRDHGVAVLCGAFSVTATGAQPADAVRYFRYTRQTTENTAGSTGWAVWAYLGEFAITDTNRVIRADLLDALGMTDADEDGIPGAWEIAHGLDPNDATDAAKDSDGDGQTNLAEYLSGTAADDPLDVLRILSVQKTGAVVLITFTTVAGKSYQLERVDQLTETWVTVGNNVLGNGAAVIAVDPDAGIQNRRFYRVAVLP
ncbi:MAG: cellulase family glycosylhydrolase [Kiritimatiellales bacterium]|nr:cellulase family glycosylhydrolase [Kiritimatiellales bacterium]